MLPTKKNLVIVSICSLVTALILYYYFYVSVQKSTGIFCRTHYCLEVIPISDFLSITIGVIGVIALIISLDLWKIQEQFKTNKDNHESALIILKEFKIAIDNLIPPGKGPNVESLDIFRNSLNNVNESLIGLKYDNNKILSIMGLSHDLSKNHILTRHEENNPSALAAFIDAERKLIAEINEIIIDISNKLKSKTGFDCM
jgi:hypothetical protein